jgi:lysophospholipase L1-like esterase
MRVGSEVTIADYERLLHIASDVSHSVIVTGIVPRYSEGRECSSQALGINARLESLCNRLGFQFIDLWDKFYGIKYLYAKDGIHFSRKGVATLGRFIDDRLYKLDRLELEGNF